MVTNVAQIVRSPNGGIRKHIVTILDNLEDNEFESFIITDIECADATYLEYEKNISNNKVLHLSIPNLPSILDLKNILIIYKFVKNNDIGIIHGHGSKGGLYARIVGYLLNKKTIYTPHGGSIHNMHGYVMNKVYASIEYLLYFLTDIILFESVYSKEEYGAKVIGKSRKYIINNNSILIPDNFVSLKLIDIPKEKVMLCSFGILREIKGHDLTIKAVKNLVEKGYDVYLNIYGEGPLRGKIEKLIKEYKLDDRVFLKGETKTPINEMKSHHILVHSAKFESFGYVPLEALSVGLTVVSSLSGGLKEVMSNGESGFCFQDVENENELSASIEDAISNKNLRLSKFEKAKKNILKNFSQENFINNIKKHYQN